MPCGRCRRYSRIRNVDRYTCVMMNQGEAIMWNENQDLFHNIREERAHGPSVRIGQVPVGTAVLKRRPEHLTPREQEILQLVWSGLTNRMIAERLHISIKTAEAHRANMMKNLRVSNIAQLLKTALEEGLLATQAS